MGFRLLIFDKPKHRGRCIRSGPSFYTTAFKFRVILSDDRKALGPLFEGAGTALAVTGGVSYRTNDTPSVFAYGEATSLKEGGKATDDSFS